jgi:DNA replication protein DnaC
MIQQTIHKLTQMKLIGMVDGLDEQMHTTAYQQLTFDERLAMLVDKEFARREENNRKRKLKNAKLQISATVEDINFETSRKLSQPHILELAQLNWVKRAHQLIISGPTGVGKTFIACALADRACKSCLNCLYTKTHLLTAQLAMAQADGSYTKLITKLLKLDLLILDEWLREPLQPHHAQLLLDLIDDRYRNASTVFVSQFPAKQWHQRIPEPTLADAILDRIVHDAIKVELRGESMRKLTATTPATGTSLRSDSPTPHAVSHTYPQP